MALRIVMVEFKENVTALQIGEFEQWLMDLASRIPYLKNMWCGENQMSDTENHLNSNAPNVVNPEFASVWEFEDIEDIEKFITEPFHNKLASSKFKTIVKIRYVANIANN